MSIRRYPEWFIGGPWHGKDKLRECPHLQSIVRVASVVPRVLDLRDTDLVTAMRELPAVETIEEEYVYVPRRADVFGEQVTVWVGDHENPRAATNGEPPEWVQMFGQLIMAPHRLAPDGSSFDVAPFARVHRDRWETEREIRRDLERRYHDELNRLRSQVSRMAREHSLPRRSVPRTPDFDIEQEENDACLLQFKLDDEVRSVSFTNVTLYADPGDEEHPAGWVATAVGALESSPGVWEDDVAFTGYAKDKKGAIVALLADKLGYYARMTSYGKNGRIR